MVDVDDVLLLRPATARSGFAVPDAPRPPISQTEPPSSVVVASICYGERPFDDEFVEVFDRRVRPVLVETGGAPLACLRTEYAENTYPALPVRTGEHVFVWFARFGGEAELAEHLHRLEDSQRWHDDALAALTVAPRRLRLAPTARSSLR